MRCVVQLVVDYGIGDIVYLRCDDDPRRGVVTGYQIRADLRVLYIVSWPSGGDRYHWDIELTDHHEPHYDHGAPGGAPASERG